MKQNATEGRRQVHLGLVHWPIRDKAGSIICTNVTNFDVHDIARACRTYGVEKYHIINRVPEQQMFVSRLVEHWTLGSGAKYNHMRKTALGIVNPQSTVESTLASFDKPPLVVATSAQERKTIPMINFKDMKADIFEPKDDRDVLLLFGTGFGLADEVYSHCDLLLDPIKGDSADDYRHLSVRSAVSIILDRLLGA
ncbi:MAG: RNA methyltransferase [Bdellovibrionales bacterium]|nr:RNA methyltransferase [Bdellovibrionales bacterium]